MKNLIVRTSDGIRFKLSIHNMFQTGEGRYNASRKHLQAALRRAPRESLLPYEDTRFTYRLYGSIEYGVTQRHKKFIEIGCMRFVGNERRKLISWAKKA